MQRFKALVQAQTTLLTILPLLLGTIMAAYHYHHVNLGETAFGDLLSFSGQWA